MKKKHPLPSFASRRFGGKAKLVQLADHEASVLLRATRNFRAWKKVYKFGSNKMHVIPLTIPKGALFWTHRHTSKCRANKVIPRGDGESWYGHPRTVYEKGKKLRPFLAFGKHHNICASGIHFFPTEAAARRYDWT